MYKILIAENFPSLNKGELVILGGIIESFKEIGDVRTSILSFKPDFDKVRYGNNINVIDARKSLFMPYDPLTHIIWQGLSVSIMATILHIFFLLFYKVVGNDVLRIFKGELWQEYLDSDAIFIGHNGTFGIGGNLLPNIHFFSYFSYLYLPFIGKILNKPTVIYGGSIGKFRQNHKILWRWISYMLSNISLITLREETAYRNLILMDAGNSNASVTADLAFLLQPSNSDHIMEIVHAEGLDLLPRPLIGITVFQKIALKASKGYHSHIIMMRDAIDHIIEGRNASVVFLPHSIGFGHKNDDRIIAKEIYDLCKNKDRIKIITTEYSADELKGILGYVDILIGERLHSVINALSMYTPSLMLSYDGDVRLDIIRMIGQESLICYVDNLSDKDLISRIDILISDSDKIRNELMMHIPIIKEKSKDNALRLKQVLK